MSRFKIFRVLMGFSGSASQRRKDLLRPGLGSIFPAKFIIDSPAKMKTKEVTKMDRMAVECSMQKSLKPKRHVLLKVSNPTPSRKSIFPTIFVSGQREGLTKMLMRVMVVSAGHKIRA